MTDKREIDWAAKAYTQWFENKLREGRKQYVITSKYLGQQKNDPYFTCIEENQ